MRSDLLSSVSLSLSLFFLILHSNMISSVLFTSYIMYCLLFFFCSTRISYHKLQSTTTECNNLKELVLNLQNQLSNETQARRMVCISCDQVTTLLTFYIHHLSDKKSYMIDYDITLLKYPLHIDQYRWRRNVCKTSVKVI